MFPHRLKVCEPFGIPVYLDVSTLLLLLFFLGNTSSLLLDVACAAALLASIVAHELGHSLAARAFGCQTRDITLSVIGGCASLVRMPRLAWQELVVAAAGPAVSFALGFAAYLAVPFVRDDFTAALVYVAGILNITLGAFNLLPGFPMDGGRIFRSAARLFTTRIKATYAAMAVGRATAILLVLGPALGIHRLWIIPIGGNFFLRLFIAWMIWREGWREYAQTVMEERWGGRWAYSARVSAPPYGSDGDEEVEVRVKD